MNLVVGVAWAVLYLVVESSSSADGLLSSLAEAAMGELLQRMAAAAEEDDTAISGVEGGLRGCRGFGIVLAAWWLECKIIGALLQPSAV